MAFHPNPMSMAVHVEHHRQELLEQARQERLAKEAIGGVGHARRGWAQNRAGAARRARSVFVRLLPALAEPMELPQSAPGEVL